MDNAGVAMLDTELNGALIALFSVTSIFFLVRVGAAVYDRVTDREE